MVAENICNPGFTNTGNFSIIPIMRLMLCPADISVVQVTSDLIKYKKWYLFLSNTHHMFLYAAKSHNSPRPWFLYCKIDSFLFAFLLICNMIFLLIIKSI